MLVTLFSSLGSLLFDYLFIDILSAPILENPGNLNSPNMEPGRHFPRKLRTKELRSSFKIQKDARVRVIPSRLTEAYRDAVTQFTLTRGDSSMMLNSWKERKLTRLTESPSDREYRKPETTTTTPVDLAEKLFYLLFDDILKERLKIKRRIEKENFDSLWG